MAKISEKYGFANELFAPLREPSRKVIAAYQDANRFCDTTQEYVLIEQGMPHLARAIHNLAHKFPARFDSFADMLHERHLMAEYPATSELDWQSELNFINDAFDVVMRVLDGIQEALEEFHKKTDNSDFRPMALFAEELMAQNSAEYTKFLEAWARWDNDGGSKTTFDAWCKDFFDEGANG